MTLLSRPVSAATDPALVGHATDRGHHRCTAALTALFAALLAAALLLAVAPRASAHNTLLSTDPADGSTVDTAPGGITLVFDEPAQALGTEIVVTGPTGTTVSAGDAVLTDTTVTQALTGTLPAGTYSVQWRVTSADGHPLSGTLSFTTQSATTAGTEAPAVDDVAADDSAADGTLGRQTPEAIPGELEPAPTVAPTPDAAVVEEDEDTGLAAGLVVAVVVAVLGLGAVLAAVLHERRRPKDSRTED